jgi:hypothetical protein
MGWVFEDTLSLHCHKGGIEYAYCFQITFEKAETLRSIFEQALAHIVPCAMYTNCIVFQSLCLIIRNWRKRDYYLVVECNYT